MNINPNAKQMHKDQVLDLLLHYMQMDMRGKLMRALPEAYNDVVCDGREVVKVVYGSGSDRLGDEVKL